MPSTITVCTTISTASAYRRAASTAQRGIGLAVSLSIIPVEMSATVAMPDCKAVNSTESTTIASVRKLRYEW